jgi:hypothetical protein
MRATSYNVHKSDAITTTMNSALHFHALPALAVVGARPGGVLSRMVFAFSIASPIPVQRISDH